MGDGVERMVTDNKINIQTTENKRIPAGGHKYGAVRGTVSYGTKEGGITGLLLVRATECSIGTGTLKNSGISNSVW